MAKSKKSPFKKAENSVKILGVRVDSTSTSSVLKKICRRMTKGKKTVIFTPNPEFLVSAGQNLGFKKLLNSADICLPDGIGLVWAAKILGKPLKTRVAGVDVAERLLELANKKGWRVGIARARRGVVKERRQQIKILQQKYPQAKIAALEDTPGWQKENWQIIFACQGMRKQEEWIKKNFSKTNTLVFMGVGGALDFLSGFAPRAPVFIRKMGLEWLFRLLVQPWRWRRQRVLLKFVWLVILERLKIVFHFGNSLSSGKIEGFDNCSKKR